MIFTNFGNFADHQIVRTLIATCGPTLFKGLLFVDVGRHLYRHLLDEVFEEMTNGL